MAIAHDASSPARFSLATSSGSSGTESGTSASFTPPANSWVYASACINSNPSATPTFSNPTNTGGGLGTWSLVKSATNASGGSVAVWKAFVNSSVATTVTIGVTTTGNTSAATDAAAWIDVWTGAATSQTGAATASGTSSTQNISPTVSTTASGSRVAGVAVDWNATGVPTSTDTIDGYSIATQTAGGRAYKAVNSGSAGSVALNFNAGASGPQWTYALYEILAAATASTPFIPIDTDARIFPRPQVLDFAPPNLLAQQTLKLPPFTQENDGARTFWRGVYTDFQPPNLLAAKFLPPPPIAAVDLSQQVKFRWSATDFAPPNLLTQGTLKLPPFTQASDGARTFVRGIYVDFAPPNLLANLLGAAPPPVASIDLSQQVKYRWVPSFDPPNLTLGLPKPPIMPIEWTIRLEAKGVFTDFAPPNLILNTLAPLPPAPILPQDLSGIRLDTRWLGDFQVPNLLTGILPTPPPITVRPAGRHGSRAEADARYRRDTLRAKLEAFKEQQRAAEEALILSEDREVAARTKVLKKVRVRPGLEPRGLRKPVEQYAPVKRAIAQRNENLGRYRAILRSLEQAQTQLREIEAQLRAADDEAAVALMQFLMWEADWRE